MARPPLITDELIEIFAREIEEGMPIQYACDLLGISHMSYLNWTKRGEEDYDAGNETVYAAFFAATKKSYARFIKKSRDLIRSGTKGWQGVCWWLERTNPMFMPKQQIQADDEGKVTVVIGGKQKKPDNNDNNK